MAAQDPRSDVQVVAETAAQIAHPRRDPADSFVLHAPLELTARASLLPFILPEGRGAARRRIIELGETFVAHGPVAELGEVDVRAFDTVPAAASALVAALERGDVDGVDAPASWLGDQLAPTELAGVLARTVLPLLGAAAHAPILLFHLPRVAPRGEVPGRLLRPLARELARSPGVRLRWLDERGDAPAAPPAALHDALATIGQRGRPDVDFIAPTMQRIDDQETADLLGPVVGGADTGDRGREVLRCAARSMLVESTEFTPYIWTHCLTLPQAALGCASSLDDPSLALAVAASHVAGFRSAFAAESLDAALPDPQQGSLDEAFEAGPDEAAEVALGVVAEGRAQAFATLATKASAHADAHYVKYTLACLDAAADDPGHADLFLAAAAKLAGYWHALGDPT